MSHTQTTVEGAIARSISHDEVVTIKIDSEQDIQEVYYELVNTDDVARYNSVDVTPTYREIWGTMMDGSEWRVHIMQSERVGATRFARV